MSEKGKKFDGGKPDMSLLDPHFIDSIAVVLSFGKEKYGAYNYKNGLELQRIYAGIQRHLNKYHKGEMLDEESGESHLVHATTGIMFLEWYRRKKGVAIDDWLE